MALVAYASSGESDSETDENGDTGVLVSKEVKPPEPPQSKEVEEKKENGDPDPVSFELPPAIKFGDDIAWNLLSKRKLGSKAPLRILAPEIPDIEEEDQPKRKIIKQSDKGCTLFSLLPAPKCESIPVRLTPQQVIRSGPIPNHVPKKFLKPLESFEVPKKEAPKPAPKPKPKPLAPEYSDSEDEGDSAEDYFSLTKNNELPVKFAPVDLPEPVEPVKEEAKKPSFNPTPDIPEEYMIDEDSPLLGPEPNPGVELNDEALSQLCGRHAKIIKGAADDIELIEVSGDSLIPDAKEWLTKELSMEQAVQIDPEETPSSLSKRKHQITYLAHQAKVNELELKNQWAQNRMSRKQTQAKYGF